MSPPITFSRYQTNYCDYQEAPAGWTAPGGHRIQPGLEPAAFYGAVQACLGATASLDIEAAWYRAGAPEYRIHAGMIAAMRDTRIDIDARYLRLPFEPFVIVAPEGLLRDAPGLPVIDGLLVRTEQEPEQRATDPVVLALDGARIRQVPDGRPLVRKLVVMATYQDPQHRYNAFKLALRPGHTIEDAFERAADGRDGAISDWGSADTAGRMDASDGYWLGRAFVRELVALAIGTAFFGIGATRVRQDGAPALVQPAARPRHERRREQRAGLPVRPVFDVGRDIAVPRHEPGIRPAVLAGETDAERERRHLQHGHLRCGHLRWQRRGPREGPNDYELIFVAPTVVRPDLPFQPASRTVMRPDGPTVTTDMAGLA